MDDRQADHKTRNKNIGGLGVYCFKNVCKRSVIIEARLSSWFIIVLVIDRKQKILNVQCKHVRTLNIRDNDQINSKKI